MLRVFIVGFYVIKNLVRFLFFFGTDNSIDRAAWVKAGLRAAERKSAI